MGAIAAHELEEFLRSKRSVERKGKRTVIQTARGAAFVATETAKQRRVDKLFKDLAEGGGGGGKVSTGSGKDVAGRHARRVQELEDVVEALKKVVEKQQGELAGRRGRAAAAARGSSAGCRRAPRGL